MQGEPHISAHGIPEGSGFSSSGGAMIHRLCTDHFSCTRFSDKLALSKIEPDRGGQISKLPRGL